MRWLSFAVIAFITLVLQVGLTHLIGLTHHRITPDLLLMLALILAFHGSADHAPIAAWFLGLAKDISSHAVLGSYALSFAAIALLVVQLRILFFMRQAIYIMVLAFLASLLVEHVAFFMLVIHKQTGLDRYGVVLPGVFWGACLCGVIVPFWRMLMMRLHRLLGLQRRCR